MPLTQYQHASDVFKHLPRLEQLQVETTLEQYGPNNLVWQNFANRPVLNGWLIIETTGRCTRLPDCRYDYAVIDAFADKTWEQLQLTKGVHAWYRPAFSKIPRDGFENYWKQTEQMQRAQRWEVWAEDPADRYYVQVSANDGGMPRAIGMCYHARDEVNQTGDHLRKWLVKLGPCYHHWTAGPWQSTVVWWGANGCTYYMANRSYTWQYVDDDSLAVYPFVAHTATILIVAAGVTFHASAAYQPIRPNTAERSLRPFLGHCAVFHRNDWQEPFNVANHITSDPSVPGHVFLDDINVSHSDGHGIWFPKRATGWVPDVLHGLIAAATMKASIADSNILTPETLQQLQNATVKGGVVQGAIIQKEVLDEIQNWPADKQSNAGEMLASAVKEMQENTIKANKRTGTVAKKIHFANDELDVLQNTNTPSTIRDQLAVLMQQPDVPTIGYGLHVRLDERLLAAVTLWALPGELCDAIANGGPVPQYTPGIDESIKSYKSKLAKFTNQSLFWEYQLLSEFEKLANRTDLTERELDRLVKEPLGTWGPEALQACRYRPQHPTPLTVENMQSIVRAAWQRVKSQDRTAAAQSGSGGFAAMRDGGVYDNTDFKLYKAWVGEDIAALVTSARELRKDADGNQTWSFDDKEHALPELRADPYHATDLVASTVIVTKETNIAIESKLGGGYNIRMQTASVDSYSEVLKWYAATALEVWGLNLAIVPSNNAGDDLNTAYTKLPQLDRVTIRNAAAAGTIRWTAQPKFGKTVTFGSNVDSSAKAAQPVPPYDEATASAKNAIQLSKEKLIEFGFKEAAVTAALKANGNVFLRAMQTLLDENETIAVRAMGFPEAAVDKAVRDAGGKKNNLWEALVQNGTRNAKLAGRTVDSWLQDEGYYRNTKAGGAGDCGPLSLAELLLYHQPQLFKKKTLSPTRTLVNGDHILQDAGNQIRASVLPALQTLIANDEDFISTDTIPSFTIETKSRLDHAALFRSIKETIHLVYETIFKQGSGSTKFKIDDMYKISVANDDEHQTIIIGFTFKPITNGMLQLVANILPRMPIAGLEWSSVVVNTTHALDDTQRQLEIKAMCTSPTWVDDRFFRAFADVYNCNVMFAKTPNDTTIEWAPTIYFPSNEKSAENSLPTLRLWYEMHTVGRHRQGTHFEPIFPLPTSRGLDTVAHVHLTNGVTLVLSHGDLVEFDGTAVVNAANTGGRGGGGIDGQLNNASTELKDYRAQVEGTGKTIGQYQNARLETGDALTDPAESDTWSGLKVKYVIQVAAPDFTTLADATEPERASELATNLGLLQRSYTNAMKQFQTLLDASHDEPLSVAFCFLSGGIYAGDASRTMPDIISTAYTSLATAAADLQFPEGENPEIHLVMYDDPKNPGRKTQQIKDGLTHVKLLWGMIDGVKHIPYIVPKTKPNVTVGAPKPARKLPSAPPAPKSPRKQTQAPSVVPIQPQPGVVYETLADAEFVLAVFGGSLIVEEQSNANELAKAFLGRVGVVHDHELLEAVAFLARTEHIDRQPPEKQSGNVRQAIKVVAIDDVKTWTKWADIKVYAQQFAFGTEYLAAEESEDPIDFSPEDFEEGGQYANSLLVKGNQAELAQFWDDLELNVGLFLENGADHTDAIEAEEVRHMGVDTPLRLADHEKTIAGNNEDALARFNAREVRALAEARGDVLDLGEDDGDSELI
jgi:O-acetyl-ADP-ribose deacetylase (regulator of RNase III)